MRKIYKKILTFLKKKKQERKLKNSILNHISFKIISYKYNEIVLSCLGFGKGINSKGSRTATWKNVIVFNETKAKSLEKFFIEIEKRAARTGETIDQIFDSKILNLGEDVGGVLSKFKLSIKANKKTIDLLDETGVVIFRGLRENVKKYTNFINKSNRERKALIEAMYKRASSHSNKYNRENAIAKGFNDIPVSKNGTSADFDGLTKYLYNGDSAFGKVKIKVTGSRDKDFKQAFEKMGIFDPKLQKKIKRKYTWHHVDDLDEGLECTIQLVTKKAHKATYKHLGSAYQFQDLLDILKYLT